MNKLLSMKNSDVHRLLQAFENANEADDGIDVQIQGDGGADANGAAALLGAGIGVLLCDATAVMLKDPLPWLRSRQNSNSFAARLSEQRQWY